MTKWLIANTTYVAGGKIEYRIMERPLLHVCCANDHFADMNIDIRPEVNPDKVCDITKKLPFEDNSYAAAFGDFPWVKSWKWNAATAIKEMLRVAPIAYTISPWIYGSAASYPEQIYVSWRPGINHPILFVKYIRRHQHIPSGLEGK